MLSLFNVFLVSCISFLFPVENIYINGIEDYKNGDFLTAYEKFIQCIHNQDDTYSITENANIWAASCLYKLGRIDEAKELSENYELIPVDGRITAYSDSLSIEASLLYAKGEYEEALQLINEIAEREKNILGLSHYYLSNTYSFMAFCYNALGRYEEAGLSLDRSLAIASIQNSQPFYVTQLLNQSLVYYGMGKYDDSFQVLSNKVLPESFLLSKYSQVSAKTLLALLQFEYKKNDAECHSICDSLMLTEQFQNDDEILNTVLSYYVKSSNYLGLYEDALMALQKYTPELILRFGMHSEEYAQMSYYKASILSNLKKYVEAHIAYKQYFSLCNELYGERSIKSLEAIVEDAATYVFEGNFIKACEMINEVQPDITKAFNDALLQGAASSIFKETLELTTSVILVYFNLCHYLSSMTGYDEQVVDIIKRNLISMIDNLKYWSEDESFYDIIAETYRELSYYENDIDSCIAYLQKALPYAKGDNEGIKFALAEQYHRACRYDESLSLCNELAEGRDNFIGRFKLLYASLVIQKFGDWSKAGQLLKESFNEYSSYILSELAVSVSREAFWGLYSNQCLEYIKVISLSEEAQICKTAYDAALLYKGLLLNFDKEIIDIINSCKDETVKLKYLEICSEQQKPQRLDLMGQQKALLKANEELVALLNEIGGLTDKFKLRWEDVQSKLLPNEVAVEFIQADENPDYIALLLRKGWEQPEVVKIELSENLLKKAYDVPYMVLDNPLLYEQIWGPIIAKARLKEGETVYFSPFGFTYNMPIEYLCDKDGKRANEHFQLYRVSSTRDICQDVHRWRHENAILYGGLQYNMPLDSLLAISAKYPSSRNRVNLNVAELTVPDSTRSGIAPLPKTLYEVDNIARLLSSRNISCQKFTKNNGIEESFKNISGSSPSIIHVATHGFYYDTPESSRRAKEIAIKESIAGNMSQMQNKELEYIDPMSRSGLIMSGGQLAFSGISIPERLDDGILTAKEIADLNLKGTGLVVLSACQTGLGAINGDGVFGLQRAFKKAGVRTILMSLWKIDDEATSLLMSEFYANVLIKKMSLQHSLNEAQRFLRNYEYEVDVPANTDNGILIDRISARPEDIPLQKSKKVRKFENPKYWAGFILLDANN